MRIFQKIGSVILVLILVASCGPSENEMTLTGSVDGLRKGTLLLQKIEDTVLVTVDSVKVLGDSNFSFSETIESPEIYYLYVRLENGSLLDTRIPFFAEPAPITIHTTLKNFAVDAVVSGSTNQKLLEEYNAITQRYTNRNVEFVAQKLKTKNEEDSLRLAIEKQQIRLLQSKYLATVNYALKHNDKEVSPYLMLSQSQEGNIKYLDTVYNSLSKRIKESSYGKQLKDYIAIRKE